MLTTAYIVEALHDREIWITHLRFNNKFKALEGLARHLGLLSHMGAAHNHLVIMKDFSGDMVDE